MLAGDTGGLSWLNYGQTFGLSRPVVLNLGIVVITFGLTIKLRLPASSAWFLQLLFIASCNNRSLREGYTYLQRMNQTNTMKEMLVSERPYEKCDEKGAGSLSDAELLSVLLRTGTKGKMSWSFPGKF